MSKEAHPLIKSPTRFVRGVGILLVVIGVGIVAAAIATGMGSLATLYLGGAVVMSGLMTYTDPRQHLRRRLSFAAIGLILMGLYMFSR